MFPCTVCNRDVDEGNVMVNNDYAASDVQHVRVVCKACTRAGHPDHNLWEVSWIVNKPLYVMGRVLLDLTGRGGLKWSNQAVDQLFDLLAHAHPTLARDPLAG